MFVCPYCQREFGSYNSLSKHAIRFAHKVTPEQLITDYLYAGVRPLCKCGCGKETSILYGKPHPKFGEYLVGHISRIHNNYGHNQKAIDKSAETRRNQYKSGERQQWNKGLSWDDVYDKDTQDRLMIAIKSQSRRDKISKKLINVEKSDSHKKKIAEHWQEYWKKDINRDAQRIRHIKYLQSNFRKYNTSLEKEFKRILEMLKIEYEFQFNLGGYLYDFLIKNSNIIIEVDGDFYHCNPEVYPEALYEIQKHTVDHDKIKNQVAVSNNHVLLRFWENDIKKHPAKVIKTLLETIEKVK